MTSTPGGSGEVEAASATTPRRPRVQRVRGARTRLPPRGPARRRHDLARRDVVRRGLPGPEGLPTDVLDWVLTAAAVPEAEWVFDGGAWRLATAADDAERHPDGDGEDGDGAAAGPSSGPDEPQVQLAARLAAREVFAAWLAEGASAQDRRRVEAVLAERAAMARARAHVDDLRGAEAGIGRSQGAQIRVLASMAELYRAAVREPGADDGPGAGGSGDGSGQQLREALEAAGLRDLVAEVALALGWTTTTAGLLVRLAEHLVVNLPRTLERLEAGRLTFSPVKVVAHHTLDLEGQLAREVDEELFGTDGSGVGLNTTDLRAEADAAVARRDASAVRRRSRRRVSARRVTFSALGDGIAALTVVGPAPALLGVHEHLDAVAALNLADARRAAQEGRVAADGGDPYAVPGEDVADPARRGDLDAPLADHRGMPAHRFDALVSAAAAATPAGPGVARPSTGLEVHAAMSTLCGADDDPGWLEGCGWVPAWLVRQGLTWQRCRLRRLLTDPFTGDLVTVDGHTYPASWLRDPGPPSDPPRGSGGGGGRPPGPRPVPGPAPQTFRGLPVQDLPPVRTEDDAFGPWVELTAPPAPHSPEPSDADAVPGVRDSADPCSDGTCSPVDPDACPLTGAGGGQYVPGGAQDRWVRRRWQRCTHPGCTRRAARCDVDHVVPWHRGGPTCACNLEPKCRSHHLMKHATDPATWRAGRADGVDVRWTARWEQWRCGHGSSHWRSPLGLEHHSRPRPAALPRERYRPTSWPPRHPDHEPESGSRTGTATTRSRPRTAFPDQPGF